MQDDRRHDETHAEVPEDRTVQQGSSRDSMEDFGPYRLRQRIGEGGMGEVWLAEQVEPIRRRVALKIIKRGMDSREVVARFEAERQALALMNHPFVAKVHDAGMTPGGRPYFAMEYVPGVAITEYCDRHQLGIRQRLELFQQVCDGVQHAHHKALIHRDLKPSNVLVMEQDQKPVPKIIDFGVAKATSQKLTEQTMFTQLGVLIGTPEYMSPEQAELTGEDVDTRTDVYSLGVILYELLAGALPFEPTRLRAAGFDGIRRIIREEHPERPSVKITTLAELSTVAAEARRTSLSHLRHELRGDLDWITLKALDKDRGRRYDSPNDLARDIDRHLQDLPVEARPPTWTYRAGRFIRRNRLGVAFAASVLLLVVGAGSALGVLYARSLAAERRAEREATTAQKSLEFMTELFRGADPFETGGDAVTARDLMDRGAERLDGLEDEPEVQIRLMETIGDVYRELGDWDQAREILQKALDRQIALHGARTEYTAQLQYQLAYNEILAENYGRAENLLVQSFQTRQDLLGEDAQLVAHTLHLRAFGLVRDGRYAEAEPLSRRALEILDPDAPDHTRTKADFLMILGWSLSWQNKFAEAQRVLEECIRMRKEAGDYETPAMGWTLNHYGLVMVRQTDEATIREGIARLEEARAINERVFDGRHVEIAFNNSNIARGYQALGEHERAESYSRLAIEMAEEFIDDRGYLAGMKRRLAKILLAQQRFDEAEAVLRSHLAALERFPEAIEPRREANELLRGIQEAREGS